MSRSWDKERRDKGALATPWPWDGAAAGGAAEPVRAQSSSERGAEAESIDGALLSWNITAVIPASPSLGIHPSLPLSRHGGRGSPVGAVLGCLSHAPPQLHSLLFPRVITKPVLGVLGDALCTAPREGRSSAAVKY